MTVATKPQSQPQETFTPCIGSPDGYHRFGSGQWCRYCRSSPDIAMRYEMAAVRLKYGWQ